MTRRHSPIRFCLVAWLLGAFTLGLSINQDWRHYLERILGHFLWPMVPIMRQETNEWSMYLRRPSPTRQQSASAATNISFHHNQDIPPGVSVSRSVAILPATAKLVVNVEGNNNCQERDEHGDNVCHWDWNDSILTSIHSVLEQPIQHDDYVEGHVKVKKIQLVQRQGN